MNIDREKAFHWLPKSGSVYIEITVDGTSIKNYYTAAEFSRGICPDTGSFKIKLINSNGRFSDVYTGGETVKFYIDRTDATTQRFEGKVDTVRYEMDAFQTVVLEGGHLSSELLDLTVTKEYNGNKTCDEILKDIVDTYLTGYTYTNVNSSDVSPTVKWSNKPFWDAINDLCKLAVATTTSSLKRFDCFVDDDLDFHFFKENSKETTTEAVVLGQTLIKLQGFGEQTTLTKNKIIVYGDDGKGLPILRISENATDQSDYWVKELVEKNTDINTEEYAESLSDALLDNTATEKEGKASCFMLEALTPGYRIWVSEPNSKITEQIKVSKFTQKFPLKMTDVILQKKRSLATILKDQSLRTIANEEIINPYECTKSINFTFDDFSKLSAWDSNITILDGKIYLGSGTTGTATSKVYNQSVDYTKVHLLVVGEKLDGAEFKLSTKGTTDTLKTIYPNTLNTIESGKDVMLKIYLNSADVRIDSIALLLKQ